MKPTVKNGCSWMGNKNKSKKHFSIKKIKAKKKGFSFHQIPF